MRTFYGRDRSPSCPQCFGAPGGHALPFLKIHSHINDIRKLIESILTGQPIGEEVGGTLHTRQITFTVFFNQNFHSAITMQQTADFSSFETGDGFADAGEDTVFAEDGENGCEVGAGLLTGNGDTQRWHDVAEFQSSLLHEVM